MAEHFGDVANASFVLQDCLAPVEREVPEVAVPVGLKASPERANWRLQFFTSITNKPAVVMASVSICALMSGLPSNRMYRPDSIFKSLRIRLPAPRDLSPSITATSATAPANSLEATTAFIPARSY